MLLPGDENGERWCGLCKKLGRMEHGGAECAAQALEKRSVAVRRGEMCDLVKDEAMARSRQDALIGGCGGIHGCGRLCAHHDDLLRR